MLNLKLLERQLDEVLAMETSETMTSWLFKRRLNKFISSSIGDGNLLNMASDKLFILQSKSFTVDKKIEEFSKEYSSTDIMSDYLFAA